MENRYTEEEWKDISSCIDNWLINVPGGSGS